MSVRPYRDIAPAQIAPDPCRQGAGGRRRADHRPDDDQHLTADVQRHDRADPGARGGRRRHRARLLPGRGSHPALKAIVSAAHGADRRRHPFPLQARHRGGRSGAACLRINPGNIGSAAARARGGEGGQGPWLLHAHRRQRRLAGEGTAGTIRRAVSRGDGGKRAQPRADSRGQRLSSNSRSA